MNPFLLVHLKKSNVGFSAFDAKNAQEGMTLAKFWLIFKNV